jgi:hypothetical protein
MGVKRLAPRVAPILFAGALAAVTLPSRTASACHTGEQITRALFSLLAIGIDIPLTLHDAIADESSRNYAITEIVLTSGLTAGSIAFAVPRTCEEGSSDYPTSTSRERLFMGGMAAWNVALLAHGVWVLANPSAKPKWVAFVPVTVDGIHGESMGVGVAGRF